MKNEDLYVYKKSDFYEDFISSQKEYYEREQVDTLIAEKDREIALLKERICNGDVSRLTWIDDCIAKDKEIAELKDKCQMHDFFWEGCGFKKLGFKNSIDVRDYCDELKRQNEDLLPKCRKANKELRSTRHALWLMTAEWAEGMGLASCNIAIKLSVKERFFYHDEVNREKDIKKYRHRQVVFYKYADYCRKKAEA